MSHSTLLPFPYFPGVNADDVAALTPGQATLSDDALRVEVVELCALASSLACVVLMQGRFPERVFPPDVLSREAKRTQKLALALLARLCPLNDDKANTFRGSREKWYHVSENP